MINSRKTVTVRHGLNLSTSVRSIATMKLWPTQSTRLLWMKIITNVSFLQEKLSKEAFGGSGVKLLNSNNIHC